MKNFNIFPLNSLVKQAKKFNSYEEFYTFYIVDIYHGYYWHITQDANFKISSQTGPRDMSSMSTGGIAEKGAIMLTSHFELWDDYYNSHPETEERIVKRPFAVLFDASDVDPKRLRQIGRGFGNEVYLNSEDAKKLKQIAIYPIDKAKTIDEKLHKIIPNSDKELRDIYNFAHSINEHNKLRLFIKDILKESLEPFQAPVHKAYLNWKRKNVSFRGIKNVGEENGVFGSLGKGLYTASLSNKSMTKEYGERYFVVNAIPKHPKVFNTLNDWEIWFYNTLVFQFSKASGKDFPDKRDFYAKTSVEVEMQKLGYDGVVIKGREMVNFTPPDNVMYFRTEDEVKQYYRHNVHDYNNPIQENLKVQIDKTIKRILNHYTLSDSDLLGGGTFGRAYKYGPHLVLKITLDREEAIFADMIKGKKFERISNVYGVQKIKGTNFFVIVLDRLEEITDDDISQALFRISTDDNIHDINGISQEKIQWAQSEYDALINELESAPLKDGYRDVHVGNMGLKNGKLAVYDIQVYDYKRWREKKIRSIKIDENIDSKMK